MKKQLVLFLFSFAIFCSITYADSMIFYESFDDADSIASNQGTFSGTKVFVDGVRNKAIDFNGNKRVTYPLTNNFDRDKGTLYMWIISGQNGGVFDIGYLQLANSWGLYRYGGYMRMEMKNNVNAYDQAWPPNQIESDGEWHFVAVKWEKTGTTTNFEVCFDGSCKPGWDGSISNTLPDMSKDFTLGWCGWYGYSNVKMDEVMIFDYVKTDAQVKEDYDALSPREKPVCNRTKPDSIGPVVINCSGLYVDNKPFTVKGVGYQPIPIGKTAQLISNKQQMYDDVGIRQRDFPLLREMGANTVRVWSEVLSDSWMDDIYNEGVNPIYVLMGFWINCNEDYSNPTIRQNYKTAFTNYVNRFKDSPAVLAWGLGNENNLGYCSSPSVLDDYHSLIEELAEIAYQIEGANYHPVVLINGGLDPIGKKTYNADDTSLPYVDIWGTNVYTGSSFGSLFSDYTYLSGKPLLITEYGTDALNDSNNQEIQQAQSDWDLGLWMEIAASDITVGGFVMAYSDEWWKGAAFGGCGSIYTHDYHCGHGAFPTPDGWSNEEWFGIVSVADNGNNPDIATPRQIYYDYQTEWLENDTMNLQLYNGWNYISIPLQLSNNQVSSIFGSVSYNSIYTYQNGKFVKLLSSSNIVPGMPIIININGNQFLSLEGTISTTPFNIGSSWNLLAYPYSSSQDISGFGSLSAFTLTDSLWLSYDSDKPQSLNTFTRFQPGRSYWVKR